MDADWFQSIVMHGIVYAKAAEFFQSAKKKLVLLFGFPPVAFVISNRFQCVISQMKENKFLIKLLIYYFWVGVIPFELWSNKFSVKLLFVHTVLCTVRTPATSVSESKDKLCQTWSPDLFLDAWKAYKLHVRGCPRVFLWIMRWRHCSSQNKYDHTLMCSTVMYFVEDN